MYREGCGKNMFFFASQQRKRRSVVKKTDILVVVAQEDKKDYNTSISSTSKISVENGGIEA